MRLAPLLLLTATFSSALFAADMEDCRRILNDRDRLNCYDNLPNENGSPIIPQRLRGSIPLQDDDFSYNAPQGELLSKAWELDPKYRGEILRIRPYKPVYILPVFVSSKVNQTPGTPSPNHSSAEELGISNNEAKFQISLKSKLAEDVFGDNGDIWFGYTQTSHWQVYNSSISRPFRETNYEPEVMMVWRTNYSILDWQARLLSIGINHQSNGRSLPLSRSWNRVMASVSFEKADWTITVRPWRRIPEALGQDDNPDISEYLGNGDITLIKRWGKQEFSALLRHNFRPGQDGRGALQLDWAFPLAGQMRGHLQMFSGYGESMIDYNHRSNYFGLGVSLLEWY